MATLQLGILASGSGSNLQAILDAVADGSLDARVKLVIVNVPGALAMDRAKAAGVPTLLIPHRQYSDRASFDTAIINALDGSGVEWVVLAGFMRVLTPEFIAHYDRHIVNIHPALLPAFPGVHAQKQAFDYGVKVAGCTVHFVDDGVDSGPVIAQTAIAVQSDDTVESLSARILREEHLIYVQALRWLAADRVKWAAGTEGNRPKVSITPA